MHLKQWHDAFGDLLSGDPAALAASITGSAKFSAEDRLNVYRNNYQQGLISHLQHTFERCNAHVGDDYFAQLATNYINEYPPIIPSLQTYGHHFAQHLKTLLNTRPELSSMTYLPDLATVDWLCDEVYYSPQRKPWPQQNFQQLDAKQQANLTLLLSPDCRLLHSRWSLFSLWELHSEQRSHLTMAYLESPEYLLVHRDQYRIKLEKLPPHVYFLLMAVQEGLPLYQLAEQHPEGISHLPALISQGWIHDFEVTTPDA